MSYGPSQRLTRHQFYDNKSEAIAHVAKLKKLYGDDVKFAVSEAHEQVPQDLMQASLKKCEEVLETRREMLKG